MEPRDMVGKQFVLDRQNPQKQPENQNPKSGPQTPASTLRAAN